MDDNEYFIKYMTLKSGLLKLVSIVVDKEQYRYLYYDTDEDLLDLLVRKVAALRLLVNYLSTLALASLTILIVWSIIK